MEKTIGLFTIADYIILSLMMLTSMAVGIYQAFIGGKQRTNEEFLLANRNMNPVPVAMSFMASFVSAPAILGVPGEVYVYGIHWVLNIFSLLCAGVIVCRFFIPVYFRLEIVSAYEYLDLRFNKSVRMCGTFAFMGLTILFMGLVMYGPALALNVGMSLSILIAAVMVNILNPVTGMSLWGSVVITGIVCTIYTSIGGMKAVLWTDVFQVVVIFTGVLVAVVEGWRRIGSFNYIWNQAFDSERVQLNFSPDPTIRHTFWSVFVGGIFFWGHIYAVNQTMVQRYLTLATARKARIAVVIGVVGVSTIFTLVCMAGLVMNAYFKGCDPLTMGYVQKPDQIIVYYVMDLFSSTPGVPGLFVAGVFSATLSTISSGVNALAAVTLQDIVRPNYKGVSELHLTKVAKVIAFGYGILAVLVSYIISLLGSSLLKFVFNIFAIFGGPLLGVFSLGMFFSWTNSKGALSGFCFGILLTSCLVIGAIVYPDTSLTDKLPLSVDLCAVNDTLNTATAAMNITHTAITAQSSTLAARIFSVSYAWYTCIGCCSTLIVGLLISLCTGGTDTIDVDPKTLLSLSDIIPYCNLAFCKKSTQMNTNALRTMCNKKNTENNNMTEARNICEDANEMRVLRQ